MNPKRLKTISKYLSKHLRHTPDAIGLALAPGGWVEVEALLAACKANQFAIERAELDRVVATSDKQRFAFDASQTRIRANQGHSVPVDLQLEPQVPPDRLYHGTGAGSVASIVESGLDKRKRHHVHLSADRETAVKVGSRHGRPVVFAVDAAAMVAAGFMFWRSQNGVWLADRVPPQYLQRLDAIDGQNAI
ncbi:MAG: RNA 2'-phosphotransferase [Geitlerinemataceae cyanobacterium]